MEEGPLMIDRCYSSITLVWPIPKHSNGVDVTTTTNNTADSKGLMYDRLETFYIYELQMNDCNTTDEWRTLSDTIRTNSIKKNNLMPRVGYRFRVRYQSMNQQSNGWSSYSISSIEYYVLSPEFKMMKPPTMVTNDDVSITLEWETVDCAIGEA